MRAMRELLTERWHELPAGEQAVLRAVVSTMRVMKRSPNGGVVRAARKWEPTLVGFIGTRLAAERLQRRKRGRWVASSSRMKERMP